VKVANQILGAMKKGEFPAYLFIDFEITLLSDSKGGVHHSRQYVIFEILTQLLAKY
jgi:hypothetical protein